MPGLSVAPGGTFLLAFFYFLLAVRPTLLEGQSRVQHLAQITSSDTSLSMALGYRKSIQLEILNRGATSWPHAGNYPVRLSFHILSESGNLLVWDGPRVRLSETVSPGQKIVTSVDIDSSVFPKEGSYSVVFDLVQEGVAWFSAGGSPTLSVPARVYVIQPDSISAGDLKNPPASKLETGNQALDLLWKHIHSVFQATARLVPKDGAAYGGFVAGGGYPQFWTRDSYTSSLGARWFFDETHLLGWARLHLEAQQTDGSIYDWIDLQGRKEKNTVETDQEASLVLGVAHYVLSTGEFQLLREIIDNHTILERLEKALEYVWSYRRDPEGTLIAGAHTIDWGDVDIIDVDQKATDVDEQTIWTTDIYDQAIFILATESLAQLFFETGKELKGSLWRDRSRQISEKTRETLWQARRGFFKVHEHLSEYSHPFDEGTLFVLGGNALAVVSGITTRDMALSIFRTALARQSQYEVSTISGAVLPPYPSGTFLHPSVSEEYTYQNGGQWDWFGSRLILAMYRLGLDHQATELLGQIAEKVVNNGGIFEWNSRSGEARGSKWYSGAAGVLAQAVVEGYFGIELSSSSLTVTPRMGRKQSRICLREPSTDRFVSYVYDHQEAKRLRFQFFTSEPSAELRIRLADSESPEALIVNGRQQQFRTESLPSGRYLVADLTGEVDLLLTFR